MLTEKYTFIALDNFKAILQNKGIGSKLEAWLTFLAVDDPEWIERLISEYPEFRIMYSEVYELCRNLEEVMGMYSKELQELDEGTIQYMIDEMQEQLREKDDKLKEKDDRLKEQDNQLKEKNDRLKEQDNRLKEKDNELKEALSQLEELRRRIQILETPVK